MNSYPKDDEIIMKPVNESQITIPSPDFPRGDMIGRENMKPLRINGLRPKFHISRPTNPLPTLSYCLYITYTCPPRPSIIERQSGETALLYKRLGHRTSLEGNSWGERGTIQAFEDIAISPIQYHQKGSIGKRGAQISNYKASMTDRINDENN